LTSFIFAVTMMLYRAKLRSTRALRCEPHNGLKAALARYRRTGDEEERSEVAAAYAGLAKYFDTPARGAWRDKLNADGSWVEEPAPGSSMYHITCAVTKLIETAEAGALPATE